MDSQNIDNHYSELISRYLSRNANDAEIAELEAWVLADPENKKQFIAFKKAWMLTGIQQEEQTINVDKLWNQTAEQLFEEAKVVEMKPSSSRGKWWGLAAAITLLLVVSFWFIRNSFENQPVFAQAVEEIESFDLPDGSHITLNQASKLRFAQAKESPNRLVELEGDAFFDVARDEARPFIIKTQGVEIEVLGTSFYVDSRKDQAEVQVIVESGRVAVRSGGQEEILEANEKAVFEKESKNLIKLANDDVNFLSIKTDSLNFDDTRYEDMAFALSRHYKVNFVVEGEDLKNCKYDSPFNNRSLEGVLKILRANSSLIVTQNGQEIILSGDCPEL